MAGSGFDWKSALIGGGIIAGIVLVGLQGYEYGVKDAKAEAAAAPASIDAVTTSAPAAPAAAPVKTAAKTQATPPKPAAVATEPQPAITSGSPVGTLPIARDRLEILQTSYDITYQGILGSYPYSGPMPEAENRRFRQCLGVTPHIIPTGFYEGLTPDLYIIQFGGYSKAEAEAVRQWVRPCAKDAYIKQARWIGD